MAWNEHEVKLNKEVVKIMLPDAADAAAALAGEHGEEAQALALDWLHAGAKAQMRNHHKANVERNAGRTLPTDWASAVEADKLAAAARGGSGAGLQHVREMVKAFRAYLAARGVPAKGIEVAAKLAGSPSALALAADAVRDKVITLLTDFAATPEGSEYAALIAQRTEAADEDGEAALLDF